MEQVYYELLFYFLNSVKQCGKVVEMQFCYWFLMNKNLIGFGMEINSKESIARFAIFFL